MRRQWRNDLILNGLCVNDRDGPVSLKLRISAVVIPTDNINLEANKKQGISGEIDYAATSGALQTGKERAVGTPKPRWGLLWS